MKANWAAPAGLAKMAARSRFVAAAIGIRIKWGHPKQEAPL